QLSGIGSPAPTTLNIRITLFGLSIGISIHICGLPRWALTALAYQRGGTVISFKPGFKLYFQTVLIISPPTYRYRPNTYIYCPEVAHRGDGTDSATSLRVRE